MITASAKFDMDFIFASGCNLYDVRNSVLRRIKGREFTPDYLLWIDSDNLVSAEGFNLLLEAIEKYDLDGCGGWYFMNSSTPPNMIAAGWNDEKLSRPTIEDMEKAAEPFPIDYFGFGCFLVKYECFTELGEIPFSPRRVEGQPRNYLGDDISFFLDSREKGRKYFIHPKVFVPHLKLLEIPVVKC